MSTKSHLALAGVALVVGFSIHSNSAATSTRVITVPTVVTRVETKTVEVKAPKSSGLPQSCLDAIKYVEVIAKSDDALSQATGEILKDMSDVGTKSFLKDVAAINKLTSKLMINKQVVADSTTDSMQARVHLQEMMTLCKHDIEAQ